MNKLLIKFFFCLKKTDFQAIKDSLITKFRNQKFAKGIFKFLKFLKFLKFKQQKKM